MLRWLLFIWLAWLFTWWLNSLVINVSCVCVLGVARSMLCLVSGYPFSIRFVQTKDDCYICQVFALKKLICLFGELVNYYKTVRFWFSVFMFTSSNQCQVPECSFFLIFCWKHLFQFFLETVLICFVNISLREMRGDRFDALFGVVVNYCPNQCEIGFANYHFGSLSLSHPVCQCYGGIEAK